MQSHLEYSLSVKDLWLCKIMTQIKLCQRQIKNEEEQHIIQLMSELA